MTSSRRALTVPLLLALALAVPAGAQTGYTFTIDGVHVPETRIAPMTGSGILTLDWTIGCGPGSPPPAASPDPEIKWAAPQAPKGVSVTGSLSESVVLPQCPTEASVDGTTAFDVQTSQAAPGLVPISVTFQGSLVTGSMTGSEATSPVVQAAIEVAYLGLVSVKAPNALKQAEPDATSEVVLQVRNLGNAASTISFEVVEGGEERLLLPSDIRLGWPAPEAPHEVVIQYAHPDSAGYDNSQEIVQLRVTPHASALPEAAGQPVNVTFQFRTSSMANGAPAGGWLAVVGLIAALAIARAGRR